MCNYEIRGIKILSIYFHYFKFHVFTYDLQVNIDVTLIFTDDILTILP